MISQDRLLYRRQVSSLFPQQNDFIPARPSAQCCTARGAAVDQHGAFLMTYGTLDDIAVVRRYLDLSDSARRWTLRRRASSMSAAGPIGTSRPAVIGFIPD
jgi:hypothetical protein